jgi:hypothetical protein
MTFPELLTQIRLHRLILRLNARRRVVYNQDLRVLIEQSRIEVCPNPNWHRKEFYYPGQGVFICAICQRLAPYVGQRSA